MGQLTLDVGGDGIVAGKPLAAGDFVGATF
jgi:hypothetical protein